MASVAILKFIFVFVFLICMKYSSASRSDLSSLINVLGQRYGSNKQPIVVIVDAHKTQDRSKAYLGDSTDTSDENIASRLSHILQHDKIKKALTKPKKSTSKPLLQLKHKHKVQKLRADAKSLEAKNVLRSPIVKTLLRISNSIQCEAKDECQDKCNNKFNGNKVYKCEMHCEEKYDCDEEDPCDKDECPNSCGDSGGDCPMSTKGERYVTEPSCKRCS